MKLKISKKLTPQQLQLEMVFQLLHTEPEKLHALALLTCDANDRCDGMLFGEPYPLRHLLLQAAQQLDVNTRMRLLTILFMELRGDDLNFCYDVIQKIYQRNHQ